jgi:hypothetical protein
VRAFTEIVSPQLVVIVSIPIPVLTTGSQIIGGAHDGCREESTMGSLALFAIVKEDAGFGGCDSRGGRDEIGGHDTREQSGGIVELDVAGGDDTEELCTQGTGF